MGARRRRAAIVLADAARVEPTATAHPPVPRDLASLWLVPDARPVPPLLLKNFARAIELVEAESFDEARPALAAPALAQARRSPTTPATTSR